VAIRSAVCRKCKSKFIGSIDPYHWFCSIRCKIAFDPSQRELKEEKKRNERVLEKRKEEEKELKIKLPAHFVKLSKRTKLKKKRKKNKQPKEAKLIQQPQQKQYSQVIILKGEPRKAHPFFDSIAWKNLKYRVYKKYPRMCMCCLGKDKELHVDHIKPRSRYPNLALEFDNLQILCRDCNMSKGSDDETDFRRKGVLSP
jgi:5-methylcytosine-specific restriction endonuclease McrA